MRIEASAPGKVVLLGEYAVLAGAPALAAAIDRRVRVEVAPGGGTWRVRSDLGPGGEATFADRDAMPRAPWTAPLRACLASLAWIESLGPLDVAIESAALREAPDGPKVGLGSSAAVVVALMAALRAWRGDERAAGDLAADVGVHRAVQGGRGSGVDVAAARLGGVLRFALEDGEPRAEPACLPGGIVFGLVHAGEAASTAGFLEGLAAFAARAPARHESGLALLHRLARRGWAACRSDDAPAWLACVRVYHAALAALGEAADLPIVSPAHADLARLLGDGPGAYKPSGAGGGDVGVVFAPSAEALASLAARAEAAGYRWLPLDVDPLGVSVRRLEGPSA